MNDLKSMSTGKGGIRRHVMQKYARVPVCTGYHLGNLCLKYTMDSMTFY